MYYQRTYLDKCATIVKGSEVNTGLNPVADLIWGKNNSRVLVYFDHHRIKSMVEDKVYPNISKLRHRLKITNAGSLDMSELHKIYASQIDANKKRRATSFDLIFFLIPELWDNGKGFDYSKNYFNSEYYDKKSYDYTLYKLEDGVNWYNARNGYPWKGTVDYQHSKDGLLDFYVKSDKLTVGGAGDSVVFTFYCKCNDVMNNAYLDFNIINNSLDNPCSMSNPICFAKNGQICHNETHKLKYGNYVEVKVDIPKNDSIKFKKHRFRIEYTIDGVTYKSSVYTISQLPAELKYYPSTDNGIYSTKTLEEELNKYEQGLDSIIIGKQHFDIGNENIDVDITTAFNKFLTGEWENCGIGIAFAPNIENSSSIYENYVGLLTNKTNSFFEPFVETTYDDVIKDDRANFVLGKENKLYLYSTIGGNLDNLDQMPTCTVNGLAHTVHQASKGIYYINIKYPNNAFTAPTMLYDRWDGLVYHGEELSPVELDFTTKSAYSYFNLGTSMPEQNAFTPSVYGIKDNEEIKRGDIRKICFLINKSYAKDVAVMIDEIEARLYIKDGTAQCDVIPYHKVNRAFVDNFIMLDTSILIPETYYIDVKIKYGMEEIEHHDVMHFKIVDDTNNRFE